MSYNYEFADYGAGGLAASSGRRENYHQLGISLDQNIRIHDSLNATLGLFYNYNRNAAKTEEFEFTQHLTGIDLQIDPVDRPDQIAASIRRNNCSPTWILRWT